MNRRRTLAVVLAAVPITCLALFAILDTWWSIDTTNLTTPTTWVIVDHIPRWIGFPLVVLFALWLVVHFGRRWWPRRPRRRGRTPT